MDELSSGWNNQALWNELKNSFKKSSNLTSNDVSTYGDMYVNQSVFIYNNDKNGLFIQKDFISSFEESLVSYGFSAVREEIDYENFYIQVAAGKDNEGNDVTPELINTDITKAAVIRHIINYGNKRNVVKSNIKVLEIQPCFSFPVSEYNKVGYTEQQLKTIKVSNSNSKYTVSKLNQISGAGQPFSHQPEKAERAKGIYKADKVSQIKRSEENPLMMALYDGMLKHRTHELLHVEYRQDNE